MADQQVPLPRLGSYVVHAIGCYDRWLVSDADDSAFRSFQDAMEELRIKVGDMADREARNEH